MKSRFLRRFTAGLLLFVPLFVLVFGLIRFFEVVQKLASPVLGFLDPETQIGGLALKAIGILVIGFAIYLLGFLADRPVVRSRVQRLDKALNSLIPGYSVIKGIIGGAVKEDSMMEGFRPVVVAYDNGLRIGFEVERTESGGVVVFLPNSPTVRSGISMLFEASQVEPLDIPPFQIIDTFGHLGRGAGAAVETGLAGLTEPEPAEQPGTGAGTDSAADKPG